MGRLSQESFTDFIASLKQAGIEISNETELCERLAEAQRWRFAFMTLATNGRPLGIRFADHSAGANAAAVRKTLARFEFPESCRETFAAKLKAD